MLWRRGVVVCLNEERKKEMSGYLPAVGLG